MIRADETFEGTWPFAPHFSRAPGFAMHYVDEGAGEPLVLLHGEPTWGYIYRKFIPPLAQRHRVIVPDHMGFGKSETPHDRVYTLETHVANLTKLFDDLRLTDIHLVMQDWGGPIGTAFALRHPDRVKKLVYLNTTIGYGTLGRRDLPSPLTASRWFQWIEGGMKNGRFEEVMKHLGTNILSVLHVIGFRNFAIVDDTFVRAYGEPFATPEECRGAIEFPMDLYRGRIKEFVKQGIPALPSLMAKPAMMVEGLRDTAIPPEIALADFKGLWPDAPLHVLETAGHYCQEDEPELIVAKILEFLGR